MRSGRLKYRITLQQQGTGSPTQNAGGEANPEWVDYKTVWAAIEPMKGRELLAAQQVNSEVTGTIRIRYNSAIAAIKSSMRAKYGTRIYDILAVVNRTEANEELLLTVRELVNDG